MTEAERREAARKFINHWRGVGDEKQHSQLFWVSLLMDVYGMENVKENVQFERRVIVDGQQKYIDVYLPETRVMIEQKGMTHDLTKPEPQSGGIMLTPYQQAKRYANNMPLDEMPRYIVTCNFQEFRIYDQNKPGQDPEVIRLEALQDAAYRMEFLVKKEHASLSEEMKISIPERAGCQNAGEASIKKRSDFEETVRKEEQALVKGVSPAVLAGYLQKISKREIGLLGRILHHI